MKKAYLFIITILIALISANGQKVEIIEQFPVFEKQKVKTFDLINESLNLTDISKIAILKGQSLNQGKQTLVNSFNSFWETANELGGNSFTIDSTYTDIDTTTMILSIYYLSEEKTKNNYELYPKNMVYVFGDLDKSKKEKVIKFNDQKLTLYPLQYISYQNQVGEEATLGIGGFLGAKVWITGKEDRLPSHFSLTGFGVGPGYGINQDVSVSFNTGRIHPVSLNFGQFLIRILDDQSQTVKY